MNKTEEEELNDSKSILKIYLENKPIIDTFIAVKKDIADLKVIVDDVDQRTPAQSEDNTGITENKELSKDTLAQIVFDHAQLAGSYFISIYDMENFRKVDYKLYNLKRMKSEDLKIAARDMITICTTYLSELADYSITLASIAEITTALADFEPKSGEPKEVRTAHTGNTKTIKNNFKALRIVRCVRLRRSLKALEKTQNDLYLKLYSFTYDDKIGAHSHRDPKAVTTTLFIKVTDAATGDPLYGVSIKETGVEEVVLTDVHGMTEIELTEGDHELNFMAFNHQNLKENVTITADDLHITVLMTPDVVI